MKKHPIFKEIETLVMQCMAASLCVMAIQACTLKDKIQPLSDTVARIPDSNLQDSLNRAAMEADRKASIDKFKAERKVKP